MKQPVLAQHLATLNLFRNPDGTVSVTVAEGKGAISELDVAGRLGSAVPHDYVMALARQTIEPKYRQACERILDMLRQDDGEAFFQAEAFLKQHAPDLYNRIGESGTLRLQSIDGTVDMEVPRGEG